MNTTIQSISQDVSQSKPDPRPVKNQRNTESRPDWILYTFPGSAFVIGIVVFIWICKTQRPRNTARKQTTHANGHTVAHTSSGSGAQNYLESGKNNKQDLMQSYENIQTAIYSNQNEVTYISADEDYLNPDAEEEVTVPDEHLNTLQLPGNLTDTDGESYENMEGCVYAQPRKRTQRIQNASEDEDYINPDDDGKQDLTLDHTDTESYEIMAGSDCIYNNSDFPAAPEDDSYILMDRITVPERDV